MPESGFLFADTLVSVLSPPSAKALFYENRYSALSAKHVNELCYCQAPLDVYKAFISFWLVDT